MALLLALALSAGCLALGLKILERLGLRHESALRYPAALILGFTLPAYLILAAGQANLLSSTYLWLLGVGFFAVGIWLTNCSGWGIALPRGTGKHQAEAICLISVFFLSISGLFLLFNCFKPEIFFDSWVYHLALPQIFLQEGSTRPLERHFFSAMPMLKEMISMWGLSLGGEPLARLLVLFWSAAGPLTLYSWGKKRGDEWAGIAAAALFVSTPIIFTALRRGAAEPLSAAFLITALYACLHQNDFKNKKSWAFIAGLLSGLFVSLKYFNALWAPLLLGLFLLQIYKRRAGDPEKAQTGAAPATPLVLTVFARQQGPRPSQLVALFFFGAALPVLPWALRNIAAFGDPFYPVLSGYLGRLASPEGWKIFVEESPHWAGPAGIWGSLHAIWRGSFNWTEPAFFIGPAYVILLLAVGAEKNYGSGQGAQSGKATAEGLVGAQLASTNGVAGVFPLIGIFLLLAWILGLSQTHHLRYLSPLLAPFALLIGLSIKGRFTKFIFIFCLGLHTFWMLRPWSNSLEWKAALGLMPRTEYLSLRYGYFWDAIEWVNAHVPEQGRVMLLGETRSYGLKRKVLASTVHDRHPLMDWTENSRDSAELLERFRSGGLTHLFYHPAEAQRLSGYGSFYFSEKGQKLWEEFSARYLKPAYTNEGIVVFLVST